MLTETGTATADDADFAQAALSDLYRYPDKQYSVALVLALLGGILGFHRAYLGMPLSFIAMFLTGGGAGFWWIRDLIVLGRLVKQVNDDQAHRRDHGLAPRALAFLPTVEDQKSLRQPVWARRRRGRLALYASGVLLAALGISVGAVAAGLGVYEPLVTVLVFLVATLLVARSSWWLRVPGLRALSLWLHRLRLFYFHVDPGPVWWLALRPVAGTVIAPFLPTVRAEVQLHLQLGFSFAALFLLLDLPELTQVTSVSAAIGVLFTQFLQTLVLTYLLVAPIGALVTRQVLLERSDRTVQALCAITAIGIWLGTLWAG